MSKMLKATYGSDKTPLRFGELEIPCYVLEDGTRVLSRSGIQRAIGYTGRSGEMLIRLVTEKNGFSPGIVAGVSHFIPFIRPTAGGSQSATNGYEATILIDICNAIIDLDRAGLLNETQQQYAVYADIIVRSVAKVGIIALIDEATGYQHNREKDELQKILSAYIAAELLPWQKRFPDEFYQEIFRLNGWDYTVNGIQNRPGVIGTWTKKLIYNLLPKGVLEELERITPKSDAGNKTKRLHQSLTLDIGEPHLEKQLISVITLMNISSNWDEFLRLFGKKFQKDLMELSVQPKFKKSTPKVSAKQYLMFGQTDLFGNPVTFDSKGHMIDIEVEEEKLSDFNNKLKTALNFNPKDNPPKD